MAQNAFRPYKGKWLLKEHTLKASAGAVEKGDMIKVTASGITVELATGADTALIGISAEDLADSTSTQVIRIWEPDEKRCEIYAKVTAGALAVGDTDSGRVCEMKTHEGIDTDTAGDQNIIIVKGVVATADGSATPGWAIIRIAQDLERLTAW